MVPYSTYYRFSPLTKLKGKNNFFRFYNFYRQYFFKYAIIFNVVLLLVTRNKKREKRFFNMKQTTIFLSYLIALLVVLALAYCAYYSYTHTGSTQVSESELSDSAFDTKEDTDYTSEFD